MPHGDVLMRNVLAAAGGRVDASTLRKLLVVAAQDGHVDAAERELLESLDLCAAGATLRDTFFAAADAGSLTNPEVVAMRERDPHFDARVAAVRAHARPGDLLLWYSPQTGFPWNVMKGAYGEWMHVSVMLADGRLLDPYWPEGLSITTVESSIAKSFTRIKASEILVARPFEPLDAMALAALTAEAESLVGKPYALVGPLNEVGDRASCSRAAWDLFRAQGLDLAPDERRWYKVAICPADLVQEPIVRVRVDGSLEMAPERPAPPRTPLAAATRVADRLMVLSPAFQRFMFSFQDPVTLIFMLTMARPVRELRPGFTHEPSKERFQPPAIKVWPRFGRKDTREARTMIRVLRR